MRKPLAVLALWVGVASCHIDKLLTDGGNKPPSQAPPARVVFSSALSSAQAGAPISPPIRVTVQDSAGHTTLRDTLITLSLGTNPSGDSLRGTKQLRSVNGVATFSDLRLEKAASGYTLTAASPELQPDTTGTFSVMPATPTALAFTVQPSSAMQDSTIKPPVQVTAYDSLGNKATNFTGPIKVAIGTDGSVGKNAQLAGAANAVSAVGGVATFPNLRIDQTGVRYTLTVAFGTATPVATSAEFDITPGPPPPPAPPTHLGFTQEPQNAQAGSAIAPPVQVAALDSADHVVQGFTGAIGLALDANPGGGTLSGAAPVNAVSGVATFPNLRIDAPGTGYRLRATASGLTDTTSRAFNITAAPPTTGDLTVTTSTSGGTPDPDGYTVTVDGGSGRGIGINGSTTFSTLTAGSHTVVLSGLAGNCTVTGGGPSRTVTVPAGGTATVPYTVDCPTPTPTTGDLSVTTSTSGASQDPDGYTFRVDAGAAQSIGVNETITITALPAGSHTVVLSGVAGNCSVSGGTSRTVTVPAGGTVTASFAVSCAATTGDLTVTTSTSGSSQDPDGYAFAVDGAAPQSIGLNQSITVTGLAAASHTVVLSGVAGNCTVGGGTSRTVTVPAGGSVTASFAVSCAALPGDLMVTTSTSGSSQDPDGYAFTVDGGNPQSIGLNQTVTISRVAAGSHNVVLSGVAGNCTVSGGTSRTVTVPAGGSVTASFPVSCAALPGDLTVTTSTSGGTPDPDGYTVTVDGGNSRSIGVNGSVTYTGLPAGSHTAQIGGLASNCTASGGNSQTVNVPAGGTASVSFSINCPTPPPPNQPPNVTAGADQDVGIGLLFTLNGASFTDADHNGPWTVTIDWGDGTSPTTFSTASEGSISRTHSYVTLLPQNYTLTVTVQDADGATDSASKTVRVVTL